MNLDTIHRRCATTHRQFEYVISTIEPFLNATTLSALNPDANEEMEQFYRGYLSDIRQLLVLTERINEKLSALLRRPTFHAEQGERLLYDAYHHSINSFFYPKYECYSEEGRYAYTGQDAIRFRKKPHRTIRDLTLSLATIFEELREELAHYETDYMNQKRLTGERV
jgi:hypothetical protein